jgi:hypothetical protein
VSSNLVNVNWILSPRQPYHPHPTNAFKRGGVPIWEVPVSAMVAPFISSALKVLGPAFMKGFFRLLHAESRLTGKPIVYLAHPSEFAHGSQRKKKMTRWEGCARRTRKYLRREYLSPAYIRTHGLRLRNLLYNRDTEALLDSTRELFAYMSSFADVEFMTVSEYVARLGRS